MKRLELIDYLKGYSIFTVILFHLLGNYSLSGIIEKGINFGGAGVHVFIVCSGFGLYLSYLNKPLKFIPFIRKRFSKVYIPYIIIILISALVPFMYHGPDKVIAVLSSVFLFRMFDETYINSFGAHFWFVSMIFQFYFVFNLLAVANKKGTVKQHLLISLVISLLWATLVGILGKENQRVWNSFFLQYLWEFVLGMQLAKLYYKNQQAIEIPKKKVLLGLSVLGIALVGYMGIKGGILKLYNDVPSLIGYLSLSLLLYSLNIKWLNRFFIFTSKFSYEWYLIHILVFACTFWLLNGVMPKSIAGVFALILSYLFAIGYNKVLKVILNRKTNNQ